MAEVADARLVWVMAVTRDGEVVDWLAKCGAGEEVLSQIALRDAWMVMEADPREAVVTVEDFVGQVVGSVAGQFEEMLIAMGAGAGAC